MSELSQDGRSDVVYSAYGHRVDGARVNGHLGHNGERCEEQTGWYLLGNGYRAFNPGLMRFHSPDSWSPFGEGGLNTYTYAMGDPVNYTDPTGHSIWGALVRALTLSTKSAGADLIPAGLRKLGSGKTSAKLFKISPEDVLNSRSKAGFYKSNVDSLNQKYDVSKGKFEQATSRAKRARYASEMDGITRDYNSQLKKFNDAVAEYKFLGVNKGRKGITRHSSADLKTYAPQPQPQTDQHQEWRRRLEINPLTPSQAAGRQRANEVRRGAEKKTLGINPD